MKSLFVRVLSSLRWPARPAISVAVAPMLFGALVVTACGGGDASMPDAGIPSAAAVTAPAIPVKRQTLYENSGEGSYAEAVQNYNHIGEALHGQ